MTAFLIVIAVIAVIVTAILSIKATVRVVYDKGWHTTVKVLFFEKEIVLSEILSMLLKSDNSVNSGSVNADTDGNKSDLSVSDTADSDSVAYSKAAEASDIPADVNDSSSIFKAEHTETSENKSATASAENNQSGKESPKKPNPIQKIWQDEGLLGILSLISNIGETANSAILTLIRGLHIYSIYVMIIVGGWDAAQIGINYGKLCSYYYPVKGLILSQMRVDDYDDYIQPDFIADKTDFEFQLIGSLSVGLLVKVALKAGFIFLKNLIINKKGD